MRSLSCYNSCVQHLPGKLRSQDGFVDRPICPGLRNRRAPCSLIVAMDGVSNGAFA